MNLLDCEIDQTAQNDVLIPLLMQDGNSTEEDLLLLMLLDSMSSNADQIERLFLDGILRKFSEEKEKHEMMLLTVLMNLLTGVTDNTYGFDNTFNMMLPIILEKCGKDDDKCKKRQKNLLVVLLAQQGIISARAFK